jgi:hypothetical protein
MTDVEWYVEIEGQRTGPVSPSDLVAMYQAGRLPGNAMATTTRMQGDWVTIADLVEAYRELNQSQRSNLNNAHTHGPSFQAPPRPTEQLEASKIINLNILPPSQAPMDATESLFLAIQAVREKAAAKNAATQAPVTLRSTQYDRDPAKGKNQLIAMAITVFMVISYGVTQLLKSDPSKKEVIKTEAAAPAAESYSATEGKPSRPATTSNIGSPKSKLLTEGGGGAVRTAPPVNTILPKGGGAIRMGDSDRSNRDAREPTEPRDRRELKDIRDARDSNAPTIRDEFGEAVDRDEGENADPRKPRAMGEGAEDGMSPPGEENDAEFPSSMEGVAPEQ